MGVGISDTSESASCPTAELQRLIAMPLVRAACLYQGRGLRRQAPILSPEAAPTVAGPVRRN